MKYIFEAKFKSVKKMLVLEQKKICAAQKKNPLMMSFDELLSKIWHDYHLEVIKS